MEPESIDLIVFEGNEPLGPYSEEGIAEEVERGTFSLLHYVLKAGGDLMRVYELPRFRGSVPAPPSLNIATRMKLARTLTGATASDPPPEKAVDSLEAEVKKTRLQWHLQFEGSEYGPLNLMEVDRILKSGKLNGQVYCWRDGLDAWTRVEEVAELQTYLHYYGINYKHQRRYRRVPLIATLLYSRFESGDSGKPRRGVCRDISGGGILIGASKLEGEVGEMVSLNIAPVELTGINAFSVHGKVVRFANQTQAFAVAFSDLSPQTFQEISQFVDRFAKPSL